MTAGGAVPRTFNGEIASDVARGAAITCLIFAASAFIPIIGFFSGLFIPLPILFYRSKLGRRFGGMVAIVSALAMLVFFGGLGPDILFFLELILIGFVLGELIERNYSIEKTILFACAAAIAAGLVCLVFAGAVTNKGVGPLLTGYVADNLKLTLALYQKMGMSAENIDMISRSLDQIQYVLIRLFPAMAVVSSIVVAWGCLLMARPILRNRSLPYPDFGPLNAWKAPEYLVWGAIASGIMLMVPDRGIKMIGLNGLLILMTVYFFQGVAIVSYFFDRKQVPRPFRIVFYSLIALQQILLLIVVGLGFFDMWANFRRLGQEENS
jgi:uncharacterized protein YybS (DUF2232 family)